MLIIAAGSVQAQHVPLPEFKNKVQLVTAENQLGDLDNTDLQTDYKPSLSGSGTARITAGGVKSKVKLSGNITDRFVVKIDKDTDPADAVELFRFTVEKKMRVIPVVTIKMGKQRDAELPKQQLKFTKVEDGVWLVSTDAQLSPGEYVFMIERPNIDIMGASAGKSLKGFCFNVE